MAAKTYMVYNSSMVTTASPVKQPTGTSIRTMMQLAPSGAPIRVIEWGCSFDANAAATPGIVELIDTGAVPATTMSTAYAVADIQPWNDPNAQANTSGSSGVPLNLGASLSAFATAAAGGEGTITATRMGDCQLIAPTNQYVKQFPLGREFEVVSGHFLRIRANFGTTVNMLCYVIFETY